jgi:hypothetical protein
MKWSHISPIALFVIANTASAAINYAPSDNTQLQLGGYVNGGYHGEKGDYADWTNISARQEAARNLESTLNSPTASATDKTNAQTNYDRIVASRPYWESRDASLSDIYLRANLGLTHKINDSYGVFAFYERDFRTEATANEDLTRDAYVGISSNYGNVRFGRDESALTHVRDLIYSMEEKDGYSYHSFIEPLSVTGRHDNTFIYSYDAKDYALEVGYVLKTEQDFVSQSAYSTSAKYIVADNLTLAAGYSGGKLSADKEGDFTRPSMTDFGYSSYDIDQVFVSAVFNPEYQITQKQYNVGLGYKSDDLAIGVTYFDADYSLDVDGADSSHTAISDNLDYKLKGGQASISYKVTKDLELASVYSRAVNDDADFAILNALTFGVEYSMASEFMLYANLGANNSDASHNQFTNAGLRFSF